MFWNHLITTVDKLKKLPSVPLAFLGFGFCRRWLTWIVSYSAIATSAGVDITTLFSTTDAVALFVLAILARKFAPLFKRGLFFLGAFILLTGGTALCFFTTNTISQVAGTCMAAVGFSMSYMLWLELYGCLNPSAMLLAYTGSMIVYVLLWFLSQMFAPANAPFVMIFYPLISMLLLAASLISIPENHIPIAACPIKLRDIGKIVLWVATFGIAYGAGDAITGKAAVSVASTLGRLIPAGIVLLGIVFLHRRFNIDIVYKFALPVMVIGFLIAFFLNAESDFAQLLMSMSLESYLILIFLISCGIAYRSRSSAIFTCGILFGTETVCVQIGKMVVSQIMATVSDNLTTSIVLGSTIIVLLIISVTFCYSERDFLAEWSVGTLLAEARHKDDTLAEKVDEIASKCGLSPKEKMVFSLLAHGLSSGEIADELFIAPGTARAHVSRIYEKLGVHSKSELKDYLVTNHIQS